MAVVSIKPHPQDNLKGKENMKLKKFKVKWNDEEVYKFLIYFGIRHDREKICKEAMKRLKFTEVDIKQIRRKNYTIFEDRLRQHSEQMNEGLSVGTFFARPEEDNKFFLKDGNHRYLNLVMRGVTKFRIAYDPDNKVW